MLKDQRFGIELIASTQVRGMELPDVVEICIRNIENGREQKKSDFIKTLLSCVHYYC